MYMRMMINDVGFIVIMYKSLQSTVGMRNISGTGTLKPFMFTSRLCVYV